MKKVVLLSLVVIISLKSLATFVLHDERDAYFSFLDKNEKMLERVAFDLVNEKIIVFSPANIKTYERIVNGQRIVEFQFTRDSLDAFSYEMSDRDLLSLEQGHLMEAYETGLSLISEERKTHFSGQGLFKRNIISTQSLEYLKDLKLINFSSTIISSPWTFNWSVLSYFLAVVLFVLFVFFQIYKQAPNKRRNKKFKFPVVFSPFFVIFVLLMIDYFISRISHSTEMSLFHLIFLNDEIWINFFGIKGDFVILNLLKGLYLGILFFIPFFSVITLVFYYKNDIIFTAPLLLMAGFIFVLFFPLILIQKTALFIVLLIFTIFFFLFMKRIKNKKIIKMYQLQKKF